MFITGSIADLSIEWVDELRRHAELGWWTLAISLVVSLGGAILMRWLLVAMPADYFVRCEPMPWEMRHPIVRWCILIGKNAIGAVLLLAGLLMLVAPGPGILTILAGVVLMDFPGKRSLEQRVLALPAVLHMVNGIRQRAGRPPLQLPEPGRCVTD